MNHKIIMGKLQLPNSGSNIIDRNRLLDKMGSFPGKKITCVVAPAGYGKTVFVKQFVDSMKQPFVWYQLDAFDNDPAQFLQYLCSGLTMALPDRQISLPEFNPADKNPGQRYYDMMAAIIGELEKMSGQELIIVLDDFHLIHEVEILKFVGYFLSYLPSNTHVIISSRYKPDLQLSRLKASESMIEINEQDLEFSQTETITLLSSKSEACLDEESIKLIHHELNGWALGLHLFKLSLETSTESPNQGVTSFKARNEIFDYISRELFAGLPPEIQEFLLFTSVLDNMTPEACNYLLDVGDSTGKLKYLEQKNLFITAIGTDEIVTYRYHHVFKAFLLGLLSTRKFEAFRKAGKYYLECGAYELAVEYFRLANDKELLIQSVEQAGSLLLQQGKLKTVETWLSILDEKGWLESPVLIMLKGELLSYGGSFAEAEEWIGRAFDLFKKSDDKEGMTRTAIHKARILRYRASFAESTRYIDEFLKEVGALPASLSLEIAAEKVYSQWLMGDIPGAVTTAEIAIGHHTDREHTKAAERLYRYMTVLYMLQGRYSAALESYEQILVSCQGNEDSLEQGSIPLYVACIHRERGHLDQALEMLKGSVVRKQQVGFTEDMHLVYFNIAVTLLGFGEWQQIDHYCRLAQEAFLKTGGQLTYYEVMLKAFHRAMASYLGQEASGEGESLMDQTIRNLRDKTAYLFAYIAPYFILYDLKYELYKKADELLEQVIPISEAIGIKFQTSMLYSLKAAVLNQYDDQKGVLFYTRRSFELAAAEKYRRFFFTFPELHPCLESAIINGLEPEFTDEIISRLGSQAVPLLFKLLKHRDSHVRGRIVKLLKICYPSQMHHQVEKLFFDIDSTVREAGAELLKEMDLVEGQIQTKLFIRCMGCFQVFRHNEWKTPVPWRTAKAKELFAYLLQRQGQPVSSERILADLWPDLDTDKARNLLHTNLTHVKSFLKRCGLKDNLQKGQNGYALDTSGISCDVWLPDGGDCSQVYLEDIYSDWPEDRRAELALQYSQTRDK